MYRSTWEVATYVRHHVADLAGERRACTLIMGSAGRVARPVTQIRHRLGLGLIKVGKTLAGYEAGRGLATAPARPATWEPGS